MNLKNFHRMQQMPFQIVEYKVLFDFHMQNPNEVNVVAPETNKLDAVTPSKLDAPELVRLVAVTDVKVVAPSTIKVEFNVVG